MQTLIQDLRFAARMMHRNPGFTALAILALALGIGANTAVFTVVNGVLLRPLAFPEPGRLFLISHTRERGPFGPQMGVADEDYLTLRRTNQSFERIASFNRNLVSLTGMGEPVRLPAATITTDFLAVLGVNPAIGRSFLPEDGRSPVALVSTQLWRTRWAANPDIVGRTIRLDGVDHTVIGVMPEGFAFPYNAAVWTPFEVRVTPGTSWLRPVVGRLKPGRTSESALTELAALLRPSNGQPQRPQDTPVAKVLPLKDLLVSRIRESLLIFAGAVAFVMLIACVNVANLLLMRAASRRQEIAIRGALGAGRGRLIRQLLTESLLISLAGGVAGIVVALWGVPALLVLAPEGRIPRLPDIRLDGTVLAFTLATSIVTGLVFGLAPAWDATRRQTRESIARSSRAGLRNALAGAEIALALVLLAGAGLMLKSFLRLRAVDPGFRAEKVLTMTVDLPSAVYRSAADIQRFHGGVLEKLAAAPGVAAAGGVNWRPMGGMGIRGDLYLESGSNYQVEKQVATPSYFRAMGIRQLRGRDFTDRDTTDAPSVVILSLAFARAAFPNEDPIGKRITLEDVPKPRDWLTIVGVVDDIRQTDLSIKPGHAVYLPYTQTARAGWLQHMTFAVRTTADPASAAPAMRAALHEVDRDQPIETLATMKDLVNRTTAEQLFQARLLAVFSILALLLAAIGVYGVLAHSVAARTREIGIRMALGAQRADVLRMVLRRTVAIAAAGIAVGIAGAGAATRVLTRLLFEVKPTDEATFVFVALVLGVVALGAGLVPARRAARVDPMVALRYE